MLLLARPPAGKFGRRRWKNYDRRKSAKKKCL